MTNTIKHIKDDAKYVKLASDDPELKNLQQMFDALGSWSFTKNGLPVANEETYGIRRLATQAEVDAGETDNIVTPKTLKVRLQQPQATEDVVGISRFTKNTEALAFGGTTSTTPKTVKYIIDNHKADENKFGSAKIASTSQAIAGALDNVVITPLKLKQAIAYMVPGYDLATESVIGITKLATVAQARAGIIREGHAISPYTFARLTGNETQAGIFKVATQAEVTGNSDTVVVTPKKLNTFKATDSKLGFVKLTTDVNNTEANTALRPTTHIMTKSGGTFDGHIYRSNTNWANRFVIESEVDGKITVSRNQLQAYVNTAVTNAVNSKLLGVNQNWYNMTGSRHTGYRYYNTTGRPIMVYIRTHGRYARCEIYVNDVLAWYINDGDKDRSNAGGTVIVPPGGNYYQGGHNRNYWAELR